MKVDDARADRMNGTLAARETAARDRGERARQAISDEPRRDGATPD